MTIPQMLRAFEDMYIDGPYDPSRASLFLKALQDGHITEDQYEQAKTYYGDLWDYVGD